MWLPQKEGGPPRLREATRQIPCALYSLYPEVEKHLMWRDFSTLARINKCSGRFHPDIIGITQSVGQTGTDRPSPITPIENLFLIGADMGHGQTPGYGLENGNALFR